MSCLDATRNQLRMPSAQHHSNRRRTQGGKTRPMRIECRNRALQGCRLDEAKQGSVSGRHITRDISPAASLLEA